MSKNVGKVANQEDTWSDQSVPDDKVTETKSILNSMRKDEMTLLIVTIAYLLTHQKHISLACIIYKLMHPKYFHRDNF